MSQRQSYRKILKKHYRTDKAGVHLYNFLRLSIFPVNWLSELVGELKTGTVLCLGCGFGTLETILAVQNPHLQFVASDLNTGRIEHASRVVKHVPNIHFTAEDATKLKIDQQYDAILYIDLMHHLAKGEQEKLIDKLWVRLKPGGTLIMKDVDTTPRWKYWWNFVHDSLMAGAPLTYYPSSFYNNYFTSLGARVTEHYPHRFHSPYNHYALMVRK